MENREKTNGGEAEIDLINQLYIGNKIEKKKNTTLSDRNSFKIQYFYTTNMVNILEIFYHFCFFIIRRGILPFLVFFIIRRGILPFLFFYHTKRYSTISVFLSYEEVFYHFCFSLSYEEVFYHFCFFLSQILLTRNDMCSHLIFCVCGCYTTMYIQYVLVFRPSHTTMYIQYVPVFRPKNKHYITFKSYANLCVRQGDKSSWISKIR